MPAGVDWFVWRLVTSERVRVGLRDLDAWTIGEMLDAHLTLDMLENAAVEAARGR